MRALQPHAGGTAATYKARSIVDSFAGAWDGSVLDVGCRSGEIGDVLGHLGTRCWGIDIHPPADIVATLEAGLPLKDGSVSTVVALDVLEHVDAIHAALAELFRASADSVIVSLPNCYDVRIRLAHLFGRPISGKYGLPAEPPPDRHKWLFSFDEARAFCWTQARSAGWTVVDEGFLVGGRRAWILPLVTRMPNLLARTYVAWFRRTALDHVRAEQPGSRANVGAP